MRLDALPLFVSFFFYFCFFLCVQPAFVTTDGSAHAHPQIHAVFFFREWINVAILLFFHTKKKTGNCQCLLRRMRREYGNNNYLEWTFVVVVCIRDLYSNSCTMQARNCDAWAVDARILSMNGNVLLSSSDYRLEHAQYSTYGKCIRRF